MTGVDRIDRQSLQFFETGPGRCRIIHNGPEGRFICIGKQITTKQIAAGRQNADAAFGVSRKLDHTRIEAIFRKCVILT